VSHIATTFLNQAKSFINFLTVLDNIFVDILDFYVFDHALNLSDHSAIIQSIRVSISNNSNSTTCHKANHKKHVINLIWDYSNLYN